MTADTLVEYGGVLVGTVHVSGEYVFVTNAIPVRPPASASANFTLNHEIWNALNAELPTLHPGQRIVGWYHSHPRFGIFLSAHDLFIQSTYFAQPWQIGYVFDPVQDVRGLFGWSNREVVRFPTWEVTSVTRGVETDLPVNAPAHGQQLAARLAAAQRSSVDAFVGVQRTDGDVVDVDDDDDEDSGFPRRKMLIASVIATVAALVLVVLIAVKVIGSKDDNKSASSQLTTQTVSDPTSTNKAVTTTTVKSTQTSTQSSSPSTTAKPTATTGSNSSIATTSTSATSSTAATTSTASTTSTSQPTTTSAAVDTPKSITAPSSRVAPGLQPCAQVSAHTYQPKGDCFVAVPNGNIATYVAGTLGCADPSGTELSANVTKFEVGIGDAPSAMGSDGTLSPGCTDLTYARNIMAQGAATLDGLCGSPQTAIDGASMRCFAQNPTTGAVLALVSATGAPTALAGECFTTGGATQLPLTWTKQAVDTDWRIVSVSFDATAGDFIARATKDGVPTTAHVACN